MVDHEVQKRGQAFYGYSSRFYPIQSNIGGMYAYSAPVKPICNDTSISGATVMSGVYLNGNFVKVGQSGLAAINHYQSTLYFTGALPASTVISSNYSVKEFDVKLTDQPEYKLLFESEYKTNNKYVQDTSGVALDVQTTPVIYLRTKTQENKPFAFAGLDNNSISIRAIVLADNVFQKTAVSTILKNFNLHQIPMVTSVPFNAMGNMTGVNYNYDTLPRDTSYVPWILSVKSIDVPQIGDFKFVARSMCYVDFELSTVRANR
jgi:hypothetical protein